ncbi:hypothetical protein PL921480026 [Planktothrix tepida PCC 9214]|uniref:Uncharacterized protein n=1 Tax=Planktothrix tepida PCC 9214 TaxID=671072 RepID=A0A1J1LVG8_9CYAN|nr:hypothetical protein PL921480026 [Planktothrix tepida PCC 9214]
MISTVRTYSHSIGIDRARFSIQCCHGDSPLVSSLTILKVCEILPKR